MKFVCAALCCGVLFAGMVQGAWAGSTAHQVGKYMVNTLSEGQSSGKAEILLGASEDQLRTFVSDGAYPTAVNAFLVRGPNKTILVDTGFGRELFKNLAQLGVQPEDVDTVLLTHMHGDHIGGLLRDGKLAFPNAEVLVARQEREYWTDAAIMNSLPEDKRGGFANAQKTLAAYGNKVRVFEPGELEQPSVDVLSDIAALAAFGHTPGHTMFLVHDGEDLLLIWGDLAHAMSIQMPVPSVAVTYDVDPAMAVASRQKVLRYVAEKGLPVAGMHIPQPGMGRVTAGEGGGYHFQ